MRWNSYSRGFCFWQECWEDDARGRSCIKWAPPRLGSRARLPGGAMRPEWRWRLPDMCVSHGGREGSGASVLPSLETFHRSLNPSISIHLHSSPSISIHLHSSPRNHHGQNPSTSTTSTTHHNYGARKNINNRSPTVPQRQGQVAKTKPLRAKPQAPRQPGLQGDRRRAPGPSTLVSPTPRQTFHPVFFFTHPVSSFHPFLSNRPPKTGPRKRPHGPRRVAVAEAAPTELRALGDAPVDGVVELAGLLADHAGGRAGGMRVSRMPSSVFQLVRHADHATQDVDCAGWVGMCT
jgi:hypothetical protein